MRPTAVTRIAHFLSFSFFLFPFSFLSPYSFGAEAASTQPLVEAQKGQVQKWFNDLADADPAVRDAARSNLMGLPRVQLDLLRRVVEANRPIAPSQAAALHDIVLQVFLAAEPYDQNPAGFLGVHHDDFHQRAVPADEDATDDAPSVAGECVIVKDRVPGFCAFRYLEDGDLLLGVIAGDFQATRSREELATLVSAISPGETITLQVMRNGKVMRLTFKLSAQPRNAGDQAEMDVFINERKTKADAYWEKTFAPLVSGKYS